MLNQEKHHNGLIKEIIKFLILSETQLKKGENPQFKGGKAYHARDSRSRKGNTGMQLGGVSIIVRNEYAHQSSVAQEVPNRDNILWIKIVTIEGTWVIGAAYSRPGFLEEHTQTRMDITEDITTLCQDKDVIGIILGGDLNTRLGTITEIMIALKKKE
jgi:hypothetical protein